MKKLEYVLSAMSMAGVTKNYYVECDHREELKKNFLGITDHSKSFTKSNTDNFDHSIAMLYNAFTETNYLKSFDFYNNFNSDNLYADSGGLQMVTAGKTITDELKRKIYKHQMKADLAMCFDVIALESVSKARNSSERVQTKNKVFNSHLHKEAAIATGQNIKEQTEFFQNNDCSTKVVIIVQGNTHRDMVDFFDGVVSQLDEHHYDNISGFAVADTCMGNKELESVDMMRAAREISLKAHPNVNKQLHLLGVGSTSRMAPTIQLMKSKYLDNIEKVSYDSSSHTMAYNNGKWYEKDLPLRKDGKLLKELYKVYDFYGDIFRPLCSFEDMTDHVIFNEEGRWAMSILYNNSMNLESINKRITASIFPYAYIMFLVTKFIKELDAFEVDNNTRINNCFRYLPKVDDEKDMEQWLVQYKNYLKSARIARSEESFILENFFE